MRRHGCANFAASRAWTIDDRRLHHLGSRAPRAQLQNHRCVDAYFEQNAMFIFAQDANQCINATERYKPRPDCSENMRVLRRRWNSLFGAETRRDMPSQCGYDRPHISSNLRPISSHCADRRRCNMRRRPRQQARNQAGCSPGVCIMVEISSLAFLVRMFIARPLRGHSHLGQPLIVTAIS